MNIPPLSIVTIQDETDKILTIPHTAQNKQPEFHQTKSQLPNIRCRLFNNFQSKIVEQGMGYILKAMSKLCNHSVQLHQKSYLLMQLNICFVVTSVLKVLNSYYYYNIHNCLYRGIFRFCVQVIMLKTWYRQHYGSFISP